MKTRNLNVERATLEDLTYILSWLKSEYDEDGGEGFWCNRSVISSSLEDGDLWVVREGGKAVAFQVGTYSPDISNVRKDKQRQGYGTALLKSSIARAIRDNVNVLKGECNPPSSLPFWLKHGFERYGDLSEWGKITVRLVLKRKFNYSSDLPQVEVVIGFYPESAIYAENVEPITVHRVIGARQEDGVVLLKRRVVGLIDDEPERRDLAVRIEIDGAERYFGKAKRLGGRQAGIERDRNGNFYIDLIRLLVD